MGSPFFSIIVPCYNQAHFLNECVWSVQSQSFTDWELIIVNDGSTDNTQELADNYVHTDPRVKVVNKPNGGLSSARNAGMGVAQGKVLQFLDADDFLLPSCLERVAHHFFVCPDIEISLVGYQYVDEIAKCVIHKVIPLYRQHYIPSIFGSNLGPCHSIFISSKFALFLGDFDETLKSAEDWDFWLRAVKAGARIGVLPSVLVAYRYVSNSMSRNAFRMYEALKTVTLRGPIMDTRILLDSEYNRNHLFDTKSILKRQVLRCLGVSVMQGHVMESVTLFKQEKNTYQWLLSLEDFEIMSSYLSFRYFRSPTEIRYVLEEVLPKFKDFFYQIDITQTEADRAVKLIFKQQINMKNHHRFGRYLGAVVNKLSMR